MNRTEHTMTDRLQRLLEIMDRLRDPDTGCPWDRQQTLQSLIPHTLEEAYEVAEAIEQQDPDALADELGDLLFQIVFYSRIAREQGRFDMNEVIERISDKLVRRHPHVFADQTITSAAAQTEAWEQHKARERHDKGAGGVLADVNRKLPALSRAVKLQKRAARVGFDWPDVSGVLDKVREELDEVEAELDGGEPAALQAEIGDLLFACLNLARHCQVDPEAALRQTNRKFEHRFARMEQALGGEAGLRERDIAALEAAWQAAKQHEN